MSEQTQFRATKGPHRPNRTASRDDHDLFRTPPEMVQLLLDREDFPGPVWECAAGFGDMSDVLRARGYQVTSSDLIARPPTGASVVTGGVDFLMTRGMQGGARSIITNPPYKLANQFTRHALDLKGMRKLALLVPISFLESVTRLKMVFEPDPPTRIWVFSGRRTLWREGVPRPEKSNGGTMCFSWFVWERPCRRSGTQIGWIE